MLTLQAVKVRTGSADEVGQLVFDDGFVVGILVRLDDPIHASKVGQWNLETSLDALPTTARPFETIDAALTWIGSNLKAPQREVAHPPSQVITSN